MTRPAVPSDADTVLRFSRGWMVVVLPLIALVLFGMGWAVVDAVTHHDAAYPWRHSGLGPTAKTVGWYVVAGLVVALVGGSVVMLRLRFVVGPGGATGRVLVAEHTLPFETLTRVRFLPVRRGGYLPQAARIRITGRDEHGRLRRLVLNASFTGLALPVVTDWVRRRPDLVKAGDDITAGFFRRVATLASTPPTAPPIGGFGTRDGGHWLPAGTADVGVVRAHQQVVDLDPPAPRTP